MMLEIYEGGFYRTREGEKAGPMIRKPGAKMFVWQGKVLNTTASWTEQGRARANGESEHDLVAEWDQPKPGKINGKAGPVAIADEPPAVPIEEAMEEIAKSVLAQADISEHEEFEEVLADLLDDDDDEDEPNDVSTMIASYQEFAVQPGNGPIDTSAPLAELNTQQARRIGELMAENAALREKVGAVEAMDAAYKELNFTPEKIAEILKDAPTAGEVKDLRERNANQARTIADNDKVLKSASDEIVRLNKVLKDARDEIVRLTGALQNEQLNQDAETIDRLRKQLADVEERHNQARNECAVYSAEVMTLKKQLEEAQQGYREGLEHREKIIRETEDLYLAAKTENGRMEEENERLKSFISDASRSMADSVPHQVAMPDEFIVQQLPNLGGYIVKSPRHSVLAAFSEKADLVSWLADAPET